MARALRIEYEGAFYHITSRGNERKRIFFSQSDLTLLVVLPKLILQNLNFDVQEGLCLKVQLLQ